MEKVSLCNPIIEMHDQHVAEGNVHTVNPDAIQLLAATVANDIESIEYTLFARQKAYLEKQGIDPTRYLPLS